MKRLITKKQTEEISAFVKKRYMDVSKIIATITKLEMDKVKTDEEKTIILQLSIMAGIAMAIQHERHPREERK